MKRAILNHKNAYFFKTENGAHVGDVFLSLIHTCQLAGENPLDYLTQLLRNASQVARALASMELPAKPQTRLTSGPLPNAIQGSGPHNPPLQSFRLGAHRTDQGSALSRTATQQKLASAPTCARVTGPPRPCEKIAPRTLAERTRMIQSMLPRLAPS